MPERHNNTMLHVKSRTFLEDLKKWLRKFVDDDENIPFR